MFLNMFIFEEYTNEEITVEHETNRQLVLLTDTYKQSSEEEKFLISDYLELTDSVTDFFYSHATVDKFAHESGRYLIIKIIFPKHENYENWLTNPVYNAQYFLHLNYLVWNGVFQVNNEVRIYLTELPIECNSFYEAQQIMLTREN